MRLYILTFYLPSGLLSCNVETQVAEICLFSDGSMGEGALHHKFTYRKVMVTMVTQILLMINFTVPPERIYNECNTVLCLLTDVCAYRRFQRLNHFHL